MKFIRQWIHAVILVVALVLFAAAFQTKHAKANGPTICPKYYQPVICDHDKTYVNQCEADRHHATNCVPLQAQ